MNQSSFLPEGKTFKRVMAARHLRGRIGKWLFYASMAVAFIALGLLMYTILRESFGVVAESYTINPDLLAKTYLEEDKPFDSLTSEELATLATVPFASDTNRLRVIVVDEVLGVSREDANFKEVIQTPVSEVLAEGNYPPELADKAIGSPPLTPEEYAEILHLNLSEGDLREFVLIYVAEMRLVESWSLTDALINSDEIQMHLDDAKFSASQETNLRTAANDLHLLAEDLAQLTEQTEENATPENLANLSTATQTLLASTTELVAQNQDLAAKSAYLPAKEAANNIRKASRNLAEINETVNSATTAKDTEALLAAAEDSLDLAEEIAEGSAITADELRANPLANAELKFRSWVNINFLTQPMNTQPEFAGIRVALLGSIWMIVLTILFAFPLGIGAAIYLEEYASDHWFNRLIQTNITNLAGVPSIIYGILGLAIFVRILEPLTSGSIFGYGDDTTANGRTLISGALTMSLLVLPIIIINAQEAIRAVPNSLRQASYGLGATQWQTIWHHVLPNAMPGILTGTILAISRAIGETAPLIVVGASTFITQNPNSPFSKFTVIPIQIYRWTSEPEPEFRDAAAAAILVLMVILLSLNSFAIILRNRFSRR